MNTPAKLTPQHLERRACVYIRQSSLHQVAENLESQDLQYQLVQGTVSSGQSRNRSIRGETEPICAFTSPTKSD